MTIYDPTTEPRNHKGIKVQTGPDLRKSRGMEEEMEQRPPSSQIDGYSPEQLSYLGKFNQSKFIDQGHNQMGSEMERVFEARPGESPAEVLKRVRKATPSVASAYEAMLTKELEMESSEKRKRFAEEVRRRMQRKTNKEKQ